MSIQSANPENIKKAAELLRTGCVVSFPTETVYGLGADATDDKAVAEIFFLKDRPSFNPLIVHVPNKEMAQRYVQWNDIAEKLASVFWPGPLTIILKRLSDSKISLLASAGGPTVGIRIPNHPVALTLLKEAGIPLAAPSANHSGRISPTTAEHVYEDFEDTITIIDGGASKIGIESTVIEVSNGKVYLHRPGFITQEQIEQVLHKKIIQPQTSEHIKSPGMLLSHYAPILPVRINVLAPEPQEALLAFGTPVPNGAKHMLNLSKKGDLKEAAANLFNFMHQLDKPDYSGIAVMPVPNEGIGIAINDRLRRAASSS